MTPARTSASIRELKEIHFRFNWAALFSLSVVAIIALALWQSRNFGFRAGLFPWAIGFPVLALALVQLGSDLLGIGGHRGVEESVGETGPPIASELVVRRTLAIIGWTIGFFIAIWLLGFSVAVPLTMILYLKAAKEKWPVALVMTFAAWAFFYGLFEYGLHVPFPEGKLFLWLGLSV